VFTRVPFEKAKILPVLYLRDVLVQGELLLDNEFSQRASFIEAFSMKYRECEGLIAEACAWRSILSGWKNIYFFPDSYFL